MISALKAAGFPGVEAEGAVIHARLWASSIEFTAVADEGAWILALHWPVRATAAQLAQWNGRHPAARMDIWQGETRVTMRVAEADIAALHQWGATAEEAVAACIGWRRAQRAPGEGM